MPCTTIDCAWLRYHVEQRIGQCHGRLDIHSGMVQLGVDAHPLVPAGAGCQAGQHRHLPQRALAVEQHRVQGADRRLELGHAVPPCARRAAA